MEPDPTLTEAAIEQLARSKSYDRRADYYDQGALVDVTNWGDDCELRSRLASTIPLTSSMA